MQMFLNNFLIFFILLQGDKGTRQDHQVSTGFGGHREKNREIKKRAAIGNTVRGFFSSGHSRQDRYNDVCIKNHAFYIVICYILLLIYKLFFYYNLFLIN